jgi:hypothetical protein
MWLPCSSCSWLFLHHKLCHEFVANIECTGRRIADMGILAYELAAWTRGRNDNEKKINWAFTSENADEKLSKHYV